MNSLKFKLETKGDTLNIKLKGRIDEDSTLKEIKADSHKKIVIDMEEVEAINSCGTREWIKWTQTSFSAKDIHFVNCSRVFIDHANMTEGVVPRNAVIESFAVPYFCSSCNAVTTKIFTASKLKKGTNEIPEKISCQRCKKDAEIDVIPNVFFKFLEKNVIH